MKKLQRRLVCFNFAYFASLALPTRIYAQSIANPSRYDSLEEVIFAFISLIQPIVLIVFVAMIMYGGWNYLTSQGSDDKIKKGKQIITAAIIGFVIIVLAPSIVSLLGNLIGVSIDLGVE